MKKYKGITKIIVYVLVILQMASFCFAKEMIKAGDTYYLIDDDSNICKNELYDIESGVRYFGEDGKMIVGWWKKPKEESVYFFRNINDRMYGAMLFGVNMIDGYTRIFGQNGKLIISKEHYVGPDGKTYNIDINGNVYDSNDMLLRDTSDARSDFYSDTKYYENISLNNRTLATEGNISLWGIIKPDTSKGELDMLKDSNNKKQVQEKINSLLSSKKIIVSNKIKK